MKKIIFYLLLIAIAMLSCACHSPTDPTSPDETASLFPEETQTIDLFTLDDFEKIKSMYPNAEIGDNGTLKSISFSSDNGLDNYVAVFTADGTYVGTTCYSSFPYVKDIDAAYQSASPVENDAMDTLKDRVTEVYNMLLSNYNISQYDAFYTYYPAILTPIFVEDPISNADDFYNALKPVIDSDYSTVGDDGSTYSLTFIGFINETETDKVLKITFFQSQYELRYQYGFE